MKELLKEVDRTCFKTKTHTHRNPVFTLFEKKMGSTKSQILLENHRGVLLYRTKNPKIKSRGKN